MVTNSENISTGNLPHFLIIGVQKSGTTSMSYYLNQHPLLQRSIPKEIHYFDKKINKGYSLEWYKNHFIPIGDSELFFEATPSYLPHYDVPKKIAEVLPNIKFIVILRNPVARVLSAYNMILKNQYDAGDSSFMELIQKERNKLNRIEDFKKFQIRRPRLLRNLLGRGLYATQLENWYQYFKKTQFLIIGFKDVVEHLEATLNRVYHFLEIKNVGFNSGDFRNHNKGDYKYLMNEKERTLLTEFYKKPNQKLIDLLGYQVNW